MKKCLSFLERSVVTTLVVLLGLGELWVFSLKAQEVPPTEVPTPATAEPSVREALEKVPVPGSAEAGQISQPMKPTTSAEMEEKTAPEENPVGSAESESELPKTEKLGVGVSPDSPAQGEQECQSEKVVPSESEQPAVPSESEATPVSGEQK